MSRILILKILEKNPICYLKVAYDEDGCYNKKDYFFEDDKYDLYLQVGFHATKRLEEKFNLVLVISSADLVQTDQRLFLTSQDPLQWASLICLSVLKVHLDLCDDSRLSWTHWEHYRGHRVSEVTLIYDTVSVPDIISLSQ